MIRSLGDNIFMMDESDDVIDSETYSRLKNVIEIITHSGLKVLDENLFKEVKKICRLSPATTRKTYSLILYQLKKNHSEVRYLSFLMCTELFKRSALFRRLLVKDLSLIFELTAETNPKEKLPPPKAVAKMLETLALSTMKKWHDEYGEVYKELRVAFCYLKHSKKVNFNLMLANNEIEEQKKRREKLLNEEKMKRLIQEIENNESEIQNTITALTNCLSLLVPLPDNFFINEDKADLGNADSEEFRTQLNFDSAGTSNPDNNALNLKDFGITCNYSISVKQNFDNSKVKVVRSEENSSIIQNAEDNVKLITNRFLPLIKKWNKTCVSSSAGNGDTVKRILKLKERMENCIKKFNELNILDNSGNQSGISDSDDDGDLQEVTKEHYECNASQFEDFDIVSTNFTPSHKKTEIEWKISTGEDGDPASALSTIRKLKGIDESYSMPATEMSTTVSNSITDGIASENMTRKDRLLACAPKLPFDVDLYHWEDENLTAPTLLSVKMDNPKFWGATSVDDMDEIPNPEGLAALRTRVIEFSGRFEPVKWSCRAPLPNGKLCPRKDRLKCPFHGKIVPRDESGVCKDETPADSDKEKMDCDWQDPELLEDIKAATGVDLKMPTKKGRNEEKKISKAHKIVKTSSSTLQEIKKRHFPGLSDTVGKQNNSRKRIEKKIFKRSALNKVAETMNKLDFAKHRDKFGDQFNYVYNT